MTIEETLNERIISNPINAYKRDLKEVSQGTIITRLFSKNKLKKEVADFGLALLSLEEVTGYTYFHLGSKEVTSLEKWLRNDMWEDKDYFNLLVYFFGDEYAVCVKKAWEKIPYRMYQNGYTRRSFRAPNNKNYLKVSQVNFLRSILMMPSVFSYKKNDSAYYNLSLNEQVRYDNEITNNCNQFLIWSVVIDMEGNSLFPLMEDILFNKDSIGKVTRNIIKALLNSDKKESWQLVEKVLLAAQRQEGLRQTILEALDETSVGALQYMINVIVENKLTRFSSVVRAIDTWTGLGWEAEKETTVRNVIQLAQQYFENPSGIAAGVKSKNNNEVYMALWVQGIFDVEKTVPYLKDLYDNGTIEKKCLAIKFASETADPHIEMPLYFKALQNENLEVLAFAIPRMESLLTANTKTKFFIDHNDYPDFFQKVMAVIQKTTVKEKRFEGKVFSWLNVKFSKEDLYGCAISLIGESKEKLAAVLALFEDLPLAIREKLAREILKEYYVYSYYYSNTVDKSKSKTPTDFQRNFAVRLLKDRGESLVASAINTLEKVELSSAEIDSFYELYKRKNSNLKRSLTKLLLKQKDSKIEKLVTELIAQGDREQRLSALDIMLQLRKANSLNSKVDTWIKEYNERPKLTEKEIQFIEQLAPLKKGTQLTAENGFGFYDPEVISPYALPKVSSTSFYATAIKNEKYGFSKPLSSLRADIKKLYKLFDENKQYEYEIEYFNGTKETQLLANDFRTLKYNTEKFTTEEKCQNYPLYEVWEKWVTDSQLQPIDLFLLTLRAKPENKDWTGFLEKHVYYHDADLPNVNKNEYSWHNQIVEIIQSLRHRFPFENSNAFLIDACSSLYADMPKSIKEYKRTPKKGEYYNRNEYGDGWQGQDAADVYLNAISFEDLTPAQQVSVWQLYRWRQFSGFKENIAKNKPPMYLYFSMYQQKVITEGEVYEGILDPDRLSIITGEKRHYQHYRAEHLTKDFPFLSPMIDKIRDTFLDIELKRGDSNTTVTHFVQSFEKIYGVDRFVSLLNGLEKSSLYKGYIYSWSYTELNKQKLFSYLIRKCYPKPTDTQETFNTIISKEKIAELRLIEASVYAPQWLKFISSHLDWKGLDSAIWWMHAHTKTSTYGDVNAELESEVAKYSAVDLQDFKDGAVDKNWFVNAYKELGKARWEMLYDSAKYVTDGNGHRRARLYADTITGDLKIREVTAKVKDKRDQDYLRVYGLVPLSKANPEKDVLARYEYIQQFKKESKDFGSMKQASEALAIRVALENLARNAGYPDPIRLTWAMETKQVQNILSKETEITLDGVTVGLTIDKEGKAELVTIKEGKELKAIPAKIKKDKAILELGVYRKTLREQWTRSRKGLEEAMVRGDEFTYAEVQNLFSHPVISKHLEKLVFVTNDTGIGFYADNNLVTADGEIIILDDSQTLRIAHCYDLHKAGVWTKYQSYCFDHKLKQPFKQIFRELYVPTPDELQEKSISRRYAGHQVQPKQTLALLKTRGWKVDYEEGLQKVYHKEGYQVKLYAMADWFSPADAESPTLETLEFHSLKEYKNIAFETINPRIFSEVMRDIDLVVSVAHVGGVDPEASHSSIEMRTVLLRETLRLFKITNVEVKGNHAIVKGTMGEYSVHLGSAVVHQMPGKYLSILPVHSQHRGRLFLPFADDDPKSAEVMSKVLLLAKDNEIQDPTILSQIDRKNQQ